MKVIQHLLMDNLRNKRREQVYYFNADTQRIESQSEDSSINLSFILKIILVATILMMGALVELKAQKHGVWGDVRFAKPQKFGMTYGGVISGNESSPTGLSALLHINDVSAMHVYYGQEGVFASGGSYNFKSPAFGISYQPRVNLRTGELNYGYYITIGGQLKQVKTEVLSTDKHGESPGESILAITKKQYAAVTYGAGMFLEVHRKWHVFLERNAKIQYAEKQNSEVKRHFTSAGLRIFLF